MSSSVRMHYADLIGQLHARKGWGDHLGLIAWMSALSRQDQDYLGWYMRQPPGTLEPSDKAPFTLQVSVKHGDFAEAAEAIAASLGKAILALGASFEEAGRNLAAGLQSAFVPPEDYIEYLDRQRFSVQLQRAFVPQSTAKWIAERIPVDLLPQRVAIRYDEFRCRLGDAILKLWSRIR